MLPQQMRLLLLVILFLPFSLCAQVDVGTNIRFTGVDEARGVDGIAPAAVGSAAITVEASLLGTAHWAEATVTGQQITLASTIPVEEYHAGMILRFIWPQDLHGPIDLRTEGLPELPLLRTDGLAFSPGQLAPGTVAEIVQAVDRWILLGPGAHGCPPGALPVHARLCMDQSSSGLLSIYNAMDHCQAKGGKLCTWDEYYAGCQSLQGQLNGAFTEWEWLDDTSNHTHTADQAGRYTCMSQRSSNPVLVQGKARCCYRLP